MTESNRVLPKEIAEKLKALGVEIPDEEIVGYWVKEARGVLAENAKKETLREFTATYISSIDAKWRYPDGLKQGKYYAPKRITDWLTVMLESEPNPNNLFIGLKTATTDAEGAFGMLKKKLNDIYPLYITELTEGDNKGKVCVSYIFIPWTIKDTAEIFKNMEILGDNLTSALGLMLVKLGEEGNLLNT